jgi:hypothetical protein
MAFGAARLNGLGKASVVVVAEVIRRKLSIAANGNAQVSTAQSQFGGSSYLGDGTGDFLTVTPRVNLTHTGTWTIECWVRITSFPADGRAIVQSYNLSSPFNGFGLQLQASSFFKFWDGSNFRNFNSSIATGTWYHLAIVSTAGSVKMYQNGVEQTTTFTLTTGFNNTTNTFTIGAAYDGSQCFPGHIDEVRISSSARYTTGFTPSTTPFVNDANTVLLLHMSGTNGSTYFEDDNGIRTQQSIAAIGNAQISTAQSQFGNSSALFDGTGDYLSMPSSLSLGTGSFTIECWCRVPSLQASVILDNRTSDQPGVFTIQANGTLLYFDPTVGAVSTSGTYTANTWFHACFERSGNTFRMYINGTASYTNTNFTSNLGTNRNVRIGISYADTAGVNGWIDEFRISSSARYNGNFTPSTAPFTNDANTLLLLHCDGTNGTTVFRDDNGEGRAPKSVRAIGNAQVDTAQSQFGGSSLLLDGTGDYLIVPTDTDIQFTSTESWTVECWVRLSTLIRGRYVISALSLAGAPFPGWGIQILGTADTFAFWDGSNNWRTFNSTIVANTWYHIAIVSTAGSVRMYQNGTQQTTTFTAASTINNTTDNLFIGATNDGSLGWPGWIDELRISNSARYSANFTPPTAPFQNDANTLLLLHMDGTDASTVFVDDNGKRPT